MKTLTGSLLIFLCF